MSVNVKLGNNTINGIDTVKLEDANTPGTYHDFVLGGGASDWEEVDIGDNDDWDLYVVLNQDNNIMGATVSVTIAGTTYSFNDDGERRIHFKNISPTRSVSWSGGGDFTKCQWMRCCNSGYYYASNNVGFSSSAGSITIGDNNNLGGETYLFVSSPES